MDRALRDCQAKGWWAEMQPGLVAAFDKAAAAAAVWENSLPDMLAQLQRVRQAIGVDAGTAANGDSRRRYAELAGALVGALERNQDMAVETWYKLNQQNSLRAPHIRHPKADLVQNVLLAVYVPGCTGELSAACCAWCGLVLMLPLLTAKLLL